MNVRDRIGAGLARASLAVAGRVGIEGAFSHRGGEAVTLRASVVSEGIEQVETNIGLSELRVLRLQIPVQPGFAYPEGEGEPVTPGDVFTYKDREWSAIQPIEKDSTGRVYLVRFVEDKPLTLG
ncbi:MAG: hypothetical protein KIS92_00880 [Planctomycetota bacterium]|nr:hypothetical protein [Planctomycetota bacterium]